MVQLLKMTNTVRQIISSLEYAILHTSDKQARNQYANRLARADQLLMTCYAKIGGKVC